MSGISLSRCARTNSIVLAAKSNHGFKEGSSWGARVRLAITGAPEAGALHKWSRLGGSGPVGKGADASAPAVCPRHCASYAIR